MKTKSIFLLLFISYQAFCQMESEVNPDGIVFPRLTTTQQNALSAQMGQFIFNTDSQTLNYLDGGNNWRSYRFNWLSDGDADTYITTEFVSDEDIIRMDVAGSHGLWIRKNINGQLYFDHGYQVGNLLLGGGGNGLNIDPATAFNNVFIGPGSGFGNQSGDSNVALGTGSFASNQIGNQNVAIGHEAMLNGTAINRSIGIGYRSLFQISSDDNIAIGTNSMQSATAASQNLVVGNNALSNFVGLGNDEIIAIGHQSLAS